MCHTVQYSIHSHIIMIVNPLNHAITSEDSNRARTTREMDLI
jgi:hypothetical protein